MYTILNTKYSIYQKRIQREKSIVVAPPPSLNLNGRRGKWGNVGGIVLHVRYFLNLMTWRGLKMCGGGGNVYYTIPPTTPPHQPNYEYASAIYALNIYVLHGTAM